MLFKKMLAAVVVLTAMTALFLVGCSEQPDTPVAPVETISTIDVSDGYETVILYAGQTINAGSVTVDVQDTYLEVTFATTGGWQLMYAQLYVAAQDTLNGNPAVGQFPYHSTDIIPGVTQYTFHIPLDDFGDGYELCDMILYIAAHAELQLVVDGNVVQTETGWGSGNPVPGANNWATYFWAQLVCTDDDDPSQQEETAWARDCYEDGINARCFTDIPGLSSNNWGWTNGTYNGQQYVGYAPGTYYFDLYAAAGQCDLDNGYLVGFVTLEYNGSTAYVTYDTHCEFAFEEIHLWVGNTLLPANRKGNLTSAPGQFPYGEVFDVPVETWSSGPINVSGNIFIAAHAVVVGDYYNYNCDAVSVCDAEPCDEWIVYGNWQGDNGYDGHSEDAIYAYDLLNESQTFLFDPGDIAASDNYPNANAYDPVNKRIYLGTESLGGVWSEFYYYDIDDVDFVQLTTNENFGTMAGASWYNGKYYYVENGTNRLYQVVIDDVAETATRSQVGIVPNNAGYGDLAFDPADPGVFVGSAGNTWYWYNLNGPSSGLLALTTPEYIGLKQLAYGSNGQLYAVVATTGQFYAVEYDRTAGTVSLTLDWDSPYRFTDLASGPQCVTP